MSRNKCRFLLYHCTYKCYLSRNKFINFFYLLLYQSLLSFEITKDTNVEIIQCLQFTFCTDLIFVQSHVLCLNCRFDRIFHDKNNSVLSRQLFDIQNKREYGRFNYVAALSPIYAHLVSLAPYHDCCQKQSLFTMLLHFHNILEVLCLKIIYLFIFFFLSQVNLS